MSSEAQMREQFEKFYAKFKLYGKPLNFKRGKLLGEEYYRDEKVETLFKGYAHQSAKDQIQPLVEALRAAGDLSNPEVLAKFRRLQVKALSTVEQQEKKDA